MGWQLPGACCYSWSIGALWFSQHWTSLYPNGGAVFFAFVGNTVFSLLSFQLMMCGCCQGKQKRRRHLGENIGRLLFLVIAVYILWRCRYMFNYIFCSGLFQFLRCLQLCALLKLLSWTGAA